MAISGAATQVAPEMLEGIQPLVDLIQPIFVKASLVVGGIFGIYLLLLISRVYYEKKKVKLLKDIRFNLDQLNIYHGIKNHKQQRGVVGGLFDFLKRKRREKKVAKEFSNDVEKEHKKKSKKKK
jgi:hypothetical protein